MNRISQRHFAHFPHMLPVDLPQVKCRTYKEDKENDKQKKRIVFYPIDPFKIVLEH